MKLLLKQPSVLLFFTVYKGPDTFGEGLSRVYLYETFGLLLRRKLKEIWLGIRFKLLCGRPRLCDETRQYSLVLSEIKSSLFVLHLDMISDLYIYIYIYIYM